MTRALASRGALLGACLLAACDSTVATPVGNLVGPVGLVTAASAAPDTGGLVVFIADAGTSSLRAFLPATDPAIFVRGPNAVSPLAIPLPFRPARLAAGTISNSAGGTLGYVLAGGGAPRVAVADAQTFELAEAATDAALCAAGTPAATCLPGSVLDVATSRAGAFALVAAGGSAGPALAVLSPALEQGRPVATLDRLVPLEGEPTGLAVLSDGSKAWVTDRSAPRVLEVVVAGGALRPVAASAPVDRVWVVPAYVSADGTAHPEGEYLLALLVDGSLQTLDPAAGAPAPDPIDAGRPIAPLRFVDEGPVVDLAFLPCAGSPCTTPLRLDIDADPVQQPLVAFAATGIGVAAALAPDPAHPQVFRPFDTNTEPGKLTAGPSFIPSADGSTDRPALAFDPAAFTDGVTRTEEFRVGFRHVVPGYDARPATFSVPAGAPQLADPRKGLLRVARAGDTVTVTPVRSQCAELAAPVTLEVTAVTDDVLTLAMPATALPDTCGPVPAVFALQAGPAAPWVVTSSARGFLGRATTGARFEVPGERLFYPADPKDGPAAAFVIEGTEPGPGATFLFVTNSEFLPFAMAGDDASTATGDASFGTGIAAAPDRIFLSVSQLRLGNGSPAAGGALVRGVPSNLGLEDSVKVFR